MMILKKRMNRMSDKDVIYRHQAIDAINALHEKPNAWLDSAVDAVMSLPSAQSEIIRCGECKHWREDHTCGEHSLVSPMMAYEFCSRAERRQDEHIG